MPLRGAARMRFFHTFTALGLAPPPPVIPLPPPSGGGDVCYATMCMKTKALSQLRTSRRGGVQGLSHRLGTRTCEAEASAPSKSAYSITPLCGARTHRTRTLLMSRESSRIGERGEGLLPFCLYVPRSGGTACRPHSPSGPTNGRPSAPPRRLGEFGWGAGVGSVVPPTGFRYRYRRIREGTQESRLIL